MNKRTILTVTLLVLISAAMLSAQQISKVTRTDYFPRLRSMAVNPSSGDVLIVYSVAQGNSPGVYVIAGRQKRKGKYAFGKPRPVSDVSFFGRSARVLWNPVTENFLLIYYDRIEQQLWLQEMNKKGRTKGARINPAFDSSQVPNQSAITFRWNTDGEIEDLVLVYQLNYAHSRNGGSSPAGLYMHVLDPVTYAVRTKSLLVERYDEFDFATDTGLVHDVQASPKGDLFVVARRQVAEPGTADDTFLHYGYMIKSNGRLRKSAVVSRYGHQPHVSARWLSKKGAVLTITREADGISSAVVAVNRRMRLKPINSDMASNGIVPDMVSSSGLNGPLLQLVVQYNADYFVFSLDNKGRQDRKLLYTTPSELTGPNLDSILSDYIEKSRSVLLLHFVGISFDPIDIEIRVLNLILDEKP